MGDNALRTLVDARDRVIQKARIAFGNRIKAAENGEDDVDPYTLDMYHRWFDTFRELEDEIDEDITDFTSDNEIVQLMCDVRGIGPILASKIVAMVDIGRADTISALWRYAGYGVVDGKAERLVKGEKAHFNQRLKHTMSVTGSSLIKKDNPYRSVYDEAVDYYTENRDWEGAHIHYASLRKVIKLFLSHLWVAWRKLEDLPVSDPYIIEHDEKHTHVQRRQDYGWPD